MPIVLINADETSTTTHATNERAHSSLNDTIQGFALIYVYKKLPKVSWCLKSLDLSQAIKGISLSQWLGISSSHQIAWLPASICALSVPYLNPPYSEPVLVPSTFICHYTLFKKCGSSGWVQKSVLQLMMQHG